MMFDMFGMNKADAREAIQEIAAGVTRGMIQAYQFELSEKQRDIDGLKQKLQEQEDYKKRYNELISISDFKKKNQEEDKHPDKEEVQNFFEKIMGETK